MGEERCDTSTLAMELRLSCINPSILLDNEYPYTCKTMSSY